MRIPTLKLAMAIGMLTIAMLPARAATAVASTSGQALTGSFIDFDRNFTLQMWQKELALQAALGHKILVLPGVGTLMPSAADQTGFTVNSQTLSYPSGLFPAFPAQADNLGMLLTAADQYGMQVFIGSLQTHGDWSTGVEFNALHKYDPMVASEVLARYGAHPSLHGGNWYFAHELWLNWAKFYGADYYGNSELGLYVAQMKALGAHARVMEAPVFKETGTGSMPGLSAAEAGIYLGVLALASHVDIVAPQDGAGAQAGAPAVAELGAYYSAMHGALAGAITSGSVQLWATTETFQAALPGTKSANGWQPAPLARIAQQIAEEAPYVSQMIQYMYGWDMSPEATYTPVEAGSLLAHYRSASRTSPVTGDAVSYSVSPAEGYVDMVPSKLTNGTGGGFGQALNADWVGFEGKAPGSPSGLVTVTLDLAGARTITGVETLFAGSAAADIQFPLGVVTEYSRDGVSWLPLAGAENRNVGVDTPVMFAIGWVSAINQTPVIASQVRVTVRFTGWLLIGEMKVVTP